MAKVPELPPGAVRTRALPGVGFTTQAPSGAFGGGLANRRVLDAATGLVETVAKGYEEERLRADKSNVRNVSLEALSEKNRLLKGETDEQGNVILPGYLQQKGTNAFETKEDYLTQWDDVKKLAETRLTNDRQKALFQSEMARIDLEFNNSVQNHEFREYDAVTVQTFKDGSNNVIEDIRLNFMEPNKIEEGIKTLTDINNDLADYQGLTAESRERLIKSGESNVHTSLIIDRINENDIKVAEEYFAQNKDNMTLDDATKVSKMFSRRDQRLGKIRKQQSPWSYFQEVGDLTVNQGFKPVNFNEPETIDDRLKFITDKSKQHKFDFDKVTFLTPDEENNIVDFLNKSNPTQAATFMRSITLNTNPKVMTKVSNQIFNKEPGYGIAMAVSADDFNTASRIVAGRRLLVGDRQRSATTGKDPILDTSARDIQEKFDSIIGNSVSDPNLRKNMREATYYHYIKGQFDGDENLQIFDEEKFEDSFNLVMGEMAEVNDVKVFSFRYKDGTFVEPDDLEHSFETLTDESIMATHGDVPRTITGEPVNVEKTVDRFTPVSSADGKYVLKRDGKLLLDKNGKPFELDMRKIMAWNEKNRKSLTDVITGFFD